MALHVFISYCRRDVEFALELERNVQRAGFTTWRDLDLMVGDDWRVEIDNGIRGALAVIAILSPEAADSMYVTYEISFALGLGVPVIPIRRDIGLEKLHPRLRALDPIEFGDGPAPAWEGLGSRLGQLVDARRPYTMRLPPNAPPVVQLAAAALDSMKAEERQAAIESLSEMNHPVAAAFLAEALSHPIAQVRFDAAVVLAGRGDVRALKPLVEGIAAGKDVQSSLIAGLGSAALPHLRECLHSTNKRLRDIAIDAMGEIGGADAVAALSERINDPDPAVRKQVVQALGATRDSTALPALRSAGNDTVEDVRAKVAIALANCGGTSVVDDLLIFLRDSAPLVRWMAASCLEDIRSEASIPALRRALEDEYDQTAINAADALLKIGDTASIPAVIRAAACHPVDNARSIMKSSIRGFPALTVSALREALDDPDGRVRATAVALLNPVGDPADLPRFVALMRDVSGEVRRNAVAALGKQAPQFVAELVSALDDEDDSVRYQAADALEECGDRTAVPKLIEALDDDSDAVARNAAQALGALRDARATPRLIESLLEEGVEQSAAWALEKIGSRDARIALQTWRKTVKQEGTKR